MLLSWLGLWFSVKGSRSTPAILKALGLAILAGGGHWFFTRCCCLLVYPEGSGDLSPFQLALTPPLVFWFWSYSPGDYSCFLNNNPKLIEGVFFCFIGPWIWLALSIVLGLMTRRRFAEVVDFPRKKSPRALNKQQKRSRGTDFPAPEYRDGPEKRV